MEIREFARNEIDPLVERIDREDNVELSLSVIRKMGKKYLPLAFPKEIGGLGKGTVYRMIFGEELSAIHYPIAVIYGSSCNLYGVPIIHFGTREQQKKFLSPIMDGSALGAIGITEATGGRDALMRGRKPQPTKLKILKGNPGKRPLNLDEPELPATPTACPKDLKGDAKKEWERLAESLVTAGVLTIGDLMTFREYCTLTGEVRAMERLVKRVGQATAHRLGYVNALLKLRKEWRAMATELGLTPSSRSRVKAAPTNVPDAAEDFFFGHERSG